ncbi:hypothetical protein BSL82_03575 [Tardibacter chloracetimidivorans]|uniref:Single-stranded DNA-binding protein n=1 Tax=Tardibacter chloracetimidivorans TaxID=1921510 RepID=A0A1L3ZS95_9SPHN|nr:DUF2815 family protein [Tardibacter chloracetimidivorans]API58497.1 hypothetical protein BSL82_03575 [Tardibacter chloracetimidivorans]
MKKTKLATPFGSARYPHISKPDSTGKYADNKYKTKLVFKIDDEDVNAMVKKIDAFAEEVHGKQWAKKHVPYVIDEDAGEIVLTAKTQYEPAVFDAKNQKIGKDVTIGGGSVLRLSGFLIEYDKGISFQLKQAQVKSVASASSDFDEVEDGYEYEGSGGFDEGDAEGGESSSGSALDL